MTTAKEYYEQFLDWIEEKAEPMIAMPPAESWGYADLSRGQKATWTRKYNLFLKACEVEKMLPDNVAEMVTRYRYDD